MCLPRHVERRHDIASYLELTAMQANKRRRATGSKGAQFGNRFAVLGDNQSFAGSSNFVHQCQAPCLEISSLYRIHRLPNSVTSISGHFSVKCRLTVLSVRAG